jgi:hypothetical protein
MVLVANDRGAADQLELAARNQGIQLASSGVVFQVGAKGKISYLRREHRRDAREQRRTW